MKGNSTGSNVVATKAFSVPFISALPVFRVSRGAQHVSLKLYAGDFFCFHAISQGTLSYVFVRFLIGIFVG